MIANIAIHRDDQENPHVTMRNVDENGFGKKNRDWNPAFSNAKENQRGFVSSNDKCLDVREEWANYANNALENAQVSERISHLSHEERGFEEVPTVHLGHEAHAMEKRGVDTERGNINRDRQEYNRHVVDLQKFREQKQELYKKIEPR
ncbi:MobA/MobL family protein [Pontibacillus yanchengensis]|uniref:MobA/MobL family protein n=1 Tax=Pontibacillus yanchengensis TaxID=462910 RepID=UPI001F3B1188|nr:MobA/MobL family protein [Pontibacillus yanchengensis]